MGFRILLKTEYLLQKSKCSIFHNIFKYNDNDNEIIALTCSRYRYITHFYCLAVEAGFYSDAVECLPLDPAAQVRIPPRAVGIFLHPVTFGGQYVGPPLATPGSAGRLASVARHVTDCAMRPGQRGCGTGG